MSTSSREASSTPPPPTLDEPRRNPDDTANNLAGYCDGGGTDSYTYDPANNLTGVATEGGSCTPGSAVQPCTVYTRDNNNRVVKVVWPTSTGAQQCDGYDNAGNLINQVATAGTCTDGTNGSVTHTGTAYDDLSYNYQLSGSGSVDSPLLQSVKDNTTGITTAYSYNNRNDLIEAAPTPSGTAYGFSYGNNGNLTQQSTNGTVTTQESQMATGQLCWTLPSANTNSCASPPSGSTTYSYDASGNETGNTPPTGTGESLSYNPLGQTTSMTATGASTALAMTYSGTDSTQRTGITTGGLTTTLTNNAFGVASSTVGSSPTTYFTYNPGGKPNTLSSVDIAGSRYYYLYDALGNVIALISSSGSTSAGATYTYKPFGGVTSSGTVATSNPFRFQGGYHDNDGWDKFGDRYYNPTTALWTQPDPQAPSINNPASYLLYSFDSNDPINNSDPTGKCSFFGCVTDAYDDVTSTVDDAADDVFGSACAADFGLAGIAISVGLAAAPFSAGVSLAIGIGVTVGLAYAATEEC